MEKSPKELLKAYVDSQKFNSTREQLISPAGGLHTGDIGMSIKKRKLLSSCLPQ